MLALVAVTLMVFNLPALAAGNGDERIQARDLQGVPTFVKGNLGTLERGGLRGTVERYLSGLTIDTFKAAGDERFRAIRLRSDELGQTHIRVNQEINGLPVIGAQLIVHIDTESRDVLSVNGKFVPSVGLLREASIGASEAIAIATAGAGIFGGQILDDSELVYVLDAHGAAHLAWRNLIRYENQDGPQADHIFADATSGALITRHPTIKHSKNWETRDANNSSSLPGSLRCTNGSCSGADAIETTIDGFTSTAYDFYSTVFGRDSFDNAGANIVSVAHFQSNYVNAFWCNNTISCPGFTGLVYGDGDGSQSGPLGNAFDVVVHELTHGVTDFESDLIYQNESGALNEAMSDILAAAAEAWVDGAITGDTWKVGEDTWTPGTAGDALRYMNDPQLGGDYDYYPTRYTGSQDNGGVHWNSGIANLAFQLLVDGGTHPRGSTSNVVPSLGMTKAQAIFYRANTVYLGPSSNFAAARTATASAAADLYGQPEVDAVHEAWDAVGVPGGGGGGGGGCQPGDTNYGGTISAGQSHVSGGASASGTLRGDLTGSAPDLDLYLEQESCSWWSCSWSTVASSLSASSTESINTSVSSGTYRWRVYGYSGSNITYTLCVNNPL
jgi:vibriolysin